MFVDGMAVLPSVTADTARVRVAEVGLRGRMVDGCDKKLEANMKEDGMVVVVGKPETGGRSRLTVVCSS